METFETIEIPELESFFIEGLITDVLFRLKSGKEATVYCCEANPSTGADLLAAKVYRPLESRGFRNDAIYQAGRVIPDKRFRRAFRNKTRTGRMVQYGMWVANEFEVLKQLHAAGTDVLKPFACSGGAILMEYLGDDETPAPQLRNIWLEPDEVKPLFNRLMNNIKWWLSCNWVHADLSPYNVLYWEGKIKVIDFPQAVDARFNRNARALLERDIENICKYFTRYGIQADPSRLTADLWRRYRRAEL